MKNSLIINEAKVLRKKYGCENQTDFINLTCDYSSITINEDNKEIIIPAYEKSLDLSYLIRVKVELVNDKQTSKAFNMIEVLLSSISNGDDFLEDNSIIINKLKSCLKSTERRSDEELNYLLEKYLVKYGFTVRKVFSIKSAGVYKHNDLEAVEKALESKGMTQFFNGYDCKIEELIKEKVISFRD